MRIAQQRIGLAESFFQHPWAVRRRVLQRHQQRAAADLGRSREQAAQIIVVAGFGSDERCVERRAIPQVHRAGRREISRLRVVRALAIVDRLDQLGDDEVDVGVALAVCVRRHVHRHAVHAGLQIGAVIEVEAAQKVLIRFAAAAVLSNDQPRHDFQQLTGAQHGSQVELLRGRNADRRRRRIAAEALELARDDDFLEPLSRRRNAARQRERRQQCY